MELTPELQGKLVQFQQLQQQLQAITTQKFQIETQLKDVERTLEELSKRSGDSAVYKSIGALMIQVEDLGKLEEELAEQKETLTIRTQTLEK